MACKKERAFLGQVLLTESSGILSHCSEVIMKSVNSGAKLLRLYLSCVIYFHMFKLMYLCHSLMTKILDA